jgi:hypothetical protein
MRRKWVLQIIMICQETINLGIEREVTPVRKIAEVLSQLEKGISGRLSGDLNEIPTSKWPKNSRLAKIADGAPKLDARQIPEWVQSPSVSERV